MLMLVHIFLGVNLPHDQLFKDASNALNQM